MANLVGTKMPYNLRSKTLAGIKFAVNQTVKDGRFMPDGLTKSYFNLKTAEGSYSRMFSAWHDLEFAASTQ